MRTKHKIFSVLVVLAIVASLFVIVAPTASAGAVTAVNVTETPATASDIAGYSIAFTTATNVAAAGTVNVTFPSSVTLPTTLSKSLISLTGVPFAAGDADPLINGQQIIVTIPAGQTLIAGNVVLTISQAAGIKNPAVAKTKASMAYPVSVVTSTDLTAGMGFIGVIPSYAISLPAGSRSTAVTVTGKGWTPNTSIAIGGDLTNAVSGGISAADGTFSVTAYPSTSQLGVTVTDGAGQTELYQAGNRNLPLGPPIITSAWDYTVATRTFTILPTISATPTSGNVGTTVTIKGYDFTTTMKIPAGSLLMAGTAVNAADIPLTTIDAFSALDDFTYTLTIPTSMPGGPKTITASDNGLPVKTGSTTYTVNSPTLALNPGTGQPNTVVTVTGSNFKAGDNIGVAGVAGVWWGNPFSVPPSATLQRLNTAAILIDASGSWSFTFTVPANAVNGVNPVLGISTGDGTGFTVGTYGFIVGSRTAVVTPVSGPMGSTVVLTASNMTPVSLIVPGNVTFGGVTGANLVALGFPAAGVTTDSLGNMPATTLKVPKNLATGPQPVTIKDSGNPLAIPPVAAVTAVGSFTVTQPTVAISPNTGYKGDTVTVTGSGWVPGMLGLVQIQFNGAIMALSTPDATGAFTASITIPASALVTNTIGGVDNYTNLPPPVTFTLAPASISLSPTSGPVGTEVTVTGKGFLPQAGLTALTIGGVPEMPANSVVTDEIGAFTATLMVPGLAVGAQTIAANVGGVNVTAFFSITSAGASAKVQLKSISAQLVRVWGYSNGTWQMYDPADAVGSDLVSLTAGLGYFVNVNAPCTIVFGGNSTNLVSGWNLIGWR